MISPLESEIDSQKEETGMLIKIYAIAWIMVGVSVGTLFVTGYVNEVTQMLIGFLISTLAFAGFLGVLPWWIDKHHSRYLKVKN